MSASPDPAAWTDPKSDEPYTDAEYHALCGMLRSRRTTKRQLEEAAFQLLITVSVLAENKDDMYGTGTVKPLTKAARRAYRAVKGMQVTL